MEHLTSYGEKKKITTTTTKSIEHKKCTNLTNCRYSRISHTETFGSDSSYKGLDNEYKKTVDVREVFSCH